MADDKKTSGTKAGAKTVEPAAPKPSLVSRLMRAPQFFAEVRQEAAKVTWPTIAETRVTTIAVFIMILMAVVFFAIVDWVLSNLVRLILG